MRLVNQLNSLKTATEFATLQGYGRCGSAVLPASVTKVFVHFSEYDVQAGRFRVLFLLYRPPGGCAASHTVRLILLFSGAIPTSLRTGSRMRLLWCHRAFLGSAVIFIRLGLKSGKQAQSTLKLQDKSYSPVSPSHQKQHRRCLVIHALIIVRTSRLECVQTQMCLALG